MNKRSPALGEAARTVGGGLALWGGVQLAAAVLERRPMAVTLVQAALAEWGAGRLGITWTDPWGPAPTVARAAGRAARGALMGAMAALTVVVALCWTGGATRGHGPPSLEVVAVGLVAAGFGAVRDELVLRGVVLRATRGLLPEWASLLVCGAAAASARFGIDGSLTPSIAAEGLRGVALGALWTRDRGAWLAWGANASWMWTLGSLTRGGLVDLRLATEPDGTATAIAVLGAIAAAALAAALAQSSPRVAGARGLR
jgi:hypothetical protein